MFSCLSRLTMWHCPHSLDARARHTAVHRAAISPYLVPKSAGTDRQTERRTPYRFIDPAQHSMHTVPVNATNDFVQLYAVSVSQRTRTV